MTEGKRRTRIVWKQPERQAIIEAAVDIDPLGHGHRLEIFRQAQDEAIRRGGLNRERRRDIQSLTSDNMAWYPEGFVAEKARRARAAGTAAKAPPSPPEPLPEPAPAEPPPAEPAAPEPAEAPEIPPHLRPVPPHLLREGLIGRPDQALSPQIPPQILSLIGGLDTVPVGDLLAALGRRFLGLAGPEDPALKQQIQSMALLLTRLDQRVQTLEQGNVAHLKLGGLDVPVRVAPAPVTQPPKPKPEPPKPKPEPPKPEPEPEPEPKPAGKPKVALVVTHSGNVDNHIRRECGKLADLVFLNKTPTIAQLRQYNLIVITKWCDKDFRAEIESNFGVDQQVYIPGNADRIAEQLKIGLMDWLAQPHQ